jgi:hypothetical protein
LENLANKFSLGNPVVVADSGLLSEKNRKALEKNGYKYIPGARIKNEKEILKQQILVLNLQNGQTALLKKGDQTRLILSQSGNRAKKTDTIGRKGCCDCKSVFRVTN